MLTRGQSPATPFRRRAAVYNNLPRRGFLPKAFPPLLPDRMTVTPAATATPSDARVEPDLSGRQIGDYQLLRRLGRGGMADVYLAEQLSLRRQVALKVLKASLAGDDAYIRR